MITHIFVDEVSKVTSISRMDGLHECATTFSVSIFIGIH